MLYIIPTDTCFWLACTINDIDWYNKIFEIKWRNSSKHLAIMIEDFDLLANFLNSKQINFLKYYERPWTILIDKKNINFSNNVFTMYIHNNEILQNYDKIAFRVANNDIQKKLISEVWEIFLTSANLSWENEIYTLKELEKTFWKNKEIKILAKKNLENTKPSDIFEFVGNSINVNYLRKN